MEENQLGELLLLPMIVVFALVCTFIDGITQTEFLIGGLVAIIVLALVIFDKVHSRKESTKEA